MKKIAFFGGTGGLGSKTIKHLQGNYDIDAISSSNVDFTKTDQIKNYFLQNSPDIVIIFSNYNFNSFIHKYNKDSEENLTKQFKVNIEGVTKCISTCLKHMRTNEYGRIILASSVTVERNVMGTGIYASCKAYYENLVKTLAIENASKNITANCIQLGYMDGGLTYTLDEKFLESVIKNIPCKRLGTTKEISDTIEFFINNSYVNGTTIKLTGGL